MSVPNNFHFSRITTKLTSSISWRRGLVTKFPTDATRNIRAAELLENLASAKHLDVAPEVWSKITPHLESDYFSESLNLANRSVGYRYRPGNINEYLGIVAEFSEGFALPKMAGSTR